LIVRFRVVGMNERFRHADSFESGFQKSVHHKKAIPGSVTLYINGPP
jgi:hypothetical protein